MISFSSQGKQFPGFTDICNDPVRRSAILSFLLCYCNLNFRYAQKFVYFFYFLYNVTPVIFYFSGTTVQRGPGSPLS
jgi:hypothetical protein